MDACAPQGAPNQLVTNINKEVIFHKMVFESRNLGPSASNSACGSTKNMSHRAGCDLRLRSRVASTTPKTCFLVQYRHCELRNFKNHDPRNRNREMIVSRWIRQPAGWLHSGISESVVVGRIKEDDTTRASVGVSRSSRPAGWWRPRTQSDNSGGGSGGSRRR